MPDTGPTTESDTESGGATAPILSPVTIAVTAVMIFGLTNTLQSEFMSTRKRTVSLMISFIFES